MRQGFVFDLDGVIVNTAVYHYRAWKELAKETGIEIDSDFNEKLKGVSRMESLELILEHGGKQNDFTADEKYLLAERKNRMYKKSLNDLSREDILPGALKFLMDAKDKKVPCSLASASKNAPYIIEKLNIGFCFDAIVDAETITKSKPDPEIFIKGAEILGVNPEYAVGFEDSQAGIEAIKRARMYAVGIVSTRQLKGADITVHRLDELSMDDLLKGQEVE